MEDIRVSGPEDGKNVIIALFRPSIDIDSKRRWYNLESSCRIKKVV